MVRSKQNAVLAALVRAQCYLHDNAAAVDVADSTTPGTDTDDLVNSFTSPVLEQDRTVTNSEEME